MSTDSPQEPAPSLLKPHRVPRDYARGYDGVVRRVPLGTGGPLPYHESKAVRYARRSKYQPKSP